GEQLDADRVILATPAYAAAELLQASAPRASELMRDIPYAPLAVVHLGFPNAQIKGDTSAFGFLAPDVEGLPVLGCIYASTLFPGRAPAGHTLFTVMIGGAKHPERTRLGERELIALATRELSRLLAISGAPSFTRAVVWPRAIPQYVVGTERRTREIREALRPHPVELAGNCWGGIGVLDVVRNATALVKRLLEPAEA
ncbi:MAG: protoporphyrinogen oxidase, partial [Myxococcales bacterium]